MTSRQIKNLIERGITVKVTRADGVIESYNQTKPDKDGESKVAISFDSDKAICMYCGRLNGDKVSCPCEQAFEMISLTGAYRHINSMVKRVGEVVYDEKLRKLYITEERRIVS